MMADLKFSVANCFIIRLSFYNSIDCHYNLEETEVRMISTLFESSRLSRSQRKKFIPFINQRDFMGGLIVDASRTAKNTKNTLSNNIAIIENLRKTTKEYFFDKKYNKMASKLKRIQDSMRYKQPDYEAEVDHCLRTVSEGSGFFKKKNAEEKYYIDLSQELSQKMSGLKQNLINQIIVKRSATQQKKRLKPVSLQEEFQLLQEAKRQATLKTQNGGRSRKITKQVFREIGEQASGMTDFTNAGLKYKSLVEKRRINPWKKWYEKEEVELFPGEKIVVKKLKKSIY